MKDVLTKRRAMALLTVALEFTAGHDGEMAEACGVADEGRGDQFLDDLNAAIRWLLSRTAINDKREAT